MPGGEGIRLGPFLGGLNLASDVTAIADSELVECSNFELDIDGSLISRPPIQEVANLSGTWTERIVCIGVGIFTGGNYLIGSNTNGVFYFLSGAWTLITNTFQATVAIQYSDKVWLIAKPGSANPGGKWDPSAGFTSVAALPKGSAAIILKERLFVVPGKDETTNPSRISFSDSGNFDSWPGTNFIDISPGDGTKLIDLTVYQDNLLLFKEDTTHLLAYDTKPSDAVLRRISSTIGASKAHCVVNYENSIYVYHEGWVYEIINYDFSRLNIKVPFVYDPTAPSSFSAEDIFLSLFGDRVIVRYYNRIYVYGLRTRTWSRWLSADNLLHYFGPLVAMPSNVAASVNNEYYAGSCITAQETVIVWRDGYDAINNEKTLAGNVTITCKIITKNYDLAISHKFKRLWWWGADIISQNSVTGKVTPTVFSFSATWGDLSTKTWGDLALNTWGQPLSTPATVSTAVGTGSGVVRRFVKFLKSLRYRQVGFELELTTNGTTTDGPARIFTILAITESKGTVGKAVN